MLLDQKKLRRLYAEERLQVRRRGGRERPIGTRAPLPQGPNQRWSLDFLHDQLSDGRHFRILAVDAIFRGAAPAVYGLHGLIALAVIMWAPLGTGWKCLIVASSLIFLAIPPIAWRFLRHIHENERFGT